MNQLPKKIWILWLQGWESAPEMAKVCRASWEGQNPNWEVVALDAHTVQNHIEVAKYINNPKLLPQAKADIIRIMLMAQHGGVWVDASVFCTQPLDEWVHEVVEPSDFFTFRRSHADKDMTIWFLASTKGGYIARTLAQHMHGFWANGGIMSLACIRIYQKMYHLVAMRFFPRIAQRFIYDLKRWGGVYPYAWPTYLFQELVRTDATFKSKWLAVPVVDGEQAIRLWREGIFKPMSESVRSFLHKHSLGLHKLKHQMQYDVDVHNPEPGSALEYLQNQKTL